jgi:hypothetical protein
MGDEKAFEFVRFLGHMDVSAFLCLATACHSRSPSRAFRRKRVSFDRECDWAQVSLLSSQRCALEASLETKCEMEARRREQVARELARYNQEYHAKQEMR